ncbi:MAG: hypothetical protein GY862_12025 [Gammaproteobacteria bacterium]|nr:hypothetical protein [Gammaproteobacteria bacterium]
MELSAVQYISDKQGRATGVVVPIELWRQIQQRLKTRTQVQQTSAWDTLENLTGSVVAQPDWAAEHDHYLYGTPKRETPDKQS